MYANSHPSSTDRKNNNQSKQDIQNAQLTTTGRKVMR